MRGAARASRDFTRAVVIDLDAENLCRTLADHFEILVRVEVEMKDDAETTTQRRRNQTGSRSGADERELRHSSLIERAAAP